jgi:hypothetical protein
MYNELRAMGSPLEIPSSHFQNAKHMNHIDRNELGLQTNIDTGFVLPLKQFQKSFLVPMIEYYDTSS